MQESIRVTEIEISADILAKLDALPDKHGGAQVAKFTEQQDAILLKYWTAKVQADVAKLIGWSKNVCARRFKELTGGENVQ